MSMAIESSATRHLCFCGETVLGATVCPDCSRVLVAALLRAADQRAAVLETDGAEREAVAL